VSARDQEVTMPQLVMARYALGHTRDGLHLVRRMLFGEWRTVHEESTREAALVG
jgi:hypothetical protein